MPERQSGGETRLPLAPSTSLWAPSVMSPWRPLTVLNDGGLLQDGGG